jgi:hypothetical protein
MEGQGGGEAQGVTVPQKVRKDVHDENNIALTLDQPLSEKQGDLVAIKPTFSLVTLLFRECRHLCRCILTTKQGHS